MMIKYVPDLPSCSLLTSQTLFFMSCLLYWKSWLRTSKLIILKYWYSMNESLTGRLWQLKLVFTGAESPLCWPCWTTKPCNPLVILEWCYKVMLLLPHKLSLLVQSQHCAKCFNQTTARLILAFWQLICVNINYLQLIQFAVCHVL